MLFFEIKAYYEHEIGCEGPVKDDQKRTRYECRQIRKAIDDLNKRLDRRLYFGLVEFENGLCRAVAVTENKKTLDDSLVLLFITLGITSEDVKVQEVTFRDFYHVINSYSCNADYAMRYDEFMDGSEVGDAYEAIRRDSYFEENLIAENTKESIVDEIGRTMYAKTLLPEIDRIYAENAPRNVEWGNPVHYMFLTIDEAETRRTAYRSLLSALYDAGRLKSRRYWFFDCNPSDNVSRKDLKAMYSTISGGTVVVRFKPIDDPEENSHASANRELIEKLCENIKKYQNDVLTVLCIPSECVKVRQMFYEYLGIIDIVEIKENTACGEDAKEYLRLLTREKSIEVDDDLFACVDNEKKYRSDELQAIFQNWWHEKLRSTIYPAYKDIKRAEAIAIKEKSHGSAYDELMEMIGLKEAKSVIRKAVDYFRAQRIFAEKGFRTDRPAMSMVFTGNPGSAKTTVARLFAEIMKDEGILETGRFVECGRGDLVGRFVGWTAPTIQKKFREAKGGVLFIDEAYSLVDDRDGSYGDEAINTIVQEMENHRSDVVVIFAGYPEQMEQFLCKNPGLRSRIAFHVPFADYDVNELCEIADLFAKKKNLIISPDAMKKMRGIFAEISLDDDFGTGRAVRNIIEAAKMSMSSRLLKGDIEKLTETDVMTLLPDDVSMPLRKTASRPVHHVVGF